MKLPIVEDGTYKAGVVYGLQTASFNALRSARKYYKKSKQASVGSVLQLQLLAKMEAANEISMQTRQHFVSFALVLSYP